MNEKLTDKGIGYLADPVTDYRSRLDAATTRGELLRVTADYKLIAKDAHAAVIAMDDKDFIEWQKGLKRERRRKINSDEWLDKYSVILLPDIMLRVAFVAHKCHAPWGCVYRQMRRGKVLQIKKGVAVLTEKATR